MVLGPDQHGASAPSRRTPAHAAQERSAAIRRSFASSIVVASPRALSNGVCGPVSDHEMASCRAPPGL